MHIRKETARYARSRRATGLKDAPIRMCASRAFPVRASDASLSAAAASDIELDAGDGRGAEQSSPADGAVRALAPYSAAAAVPMEFSISHRRPIRKRSTCERLVSPRRCGVRSVDQAQGRRETVRTLRRLLRLGHVFCGKHTRRVYAPAETAQLTQARARDGPLPSPTGRGCPPYARCRTAHEVPSP